MPACSGSKRHQVHDHAGNRQDQGHATHCGYLLDEFFSMMFTKLVAVWLLAVELQLAETGGRYKISTLQSAEDIAAGKVGNFFIWHLSCCCSDRGCLLFAPEKYLAHPDPDGYGVRRSNGLSAEDIIILRSRSS